ncbi:MAG TPA: PilZ domain-containing protein [Desulfomonilaceae bacterium]|nr:PilZ domain-containing protein [Desulfomonilaceae bacterium]
MGAKKQVPARAVVSDIRAGFGDNGLRAKYSLSQRGLGRLFKKLLTSNLITHDELYRGSCLYKENIDRIMSRFRPRADLSVKIPIYEVTSGSVGLLRDISETGLRVAGIQAAIGDEKTFQIPIDMFIRADPLLVIAECRWVKIKSKNRQYPVAGYELKAVSEADANVLRDFIEFLLMSKSGEWQVLAGNTQ